MRFILKRLNTEQTIVLDDRDCYTCGRDRKNKIVCHSPVVSRSHCIFIHTADGITIFDLGSANGTFINGTKIEPKEYVTLRLNDTVGIGSFNVDALEDQEFVYLLQSFPEDHKNDCSTKRKLEADSSSPVPKKVIRIEDPPVVFSIDDDSSDIINPSEVQNGVVSSALPIVSMKEEPILLLRNKKIPRNVEDDNEEDLREFIKKKRRCKNTSVDLTTAVENEVEFINESHSTSIPKTPKSPVLIKYELDIKDEVSSPSVPAIVDSPPIPAPPPPKDEPRLSYSQIDCDDFIDDDEDIFSASQRSDSVHNTPDRGNIFDLDNKEVFDVDNKDFCHRQEDSDVITLSDDDDEDDENNPWLMRLYQSQILNGSQIKNEETTAESVNLQAALEDLNRLDLPEENGKGEDSEVDEDVDAKPLKDDELDDISEHAAVAIEEPSKKTKSSKLSKDSRSSKELKDSKTSKETKKSKEFKESEERRKKHEKSRKPRVSISSHDSHSDDSGRLKCKEKTEKKGDKVPEKKHSGGFEKVPVKSFYKSKAKIEDDRRAFSFEESSTSRRDSIESTIQRRFSTDKSLIGSKQIKKIPQIDPPFLKKGERRGISCGIKKLNSSVEGDVSSTSVGTTDDLDEHSADFRSTSKSSTKPLKLTSKEKKEMAHQQKVESILYKNEQKRRRLQHRWADVLPPGERRRSSLTKSKREEIKHDRKEKLKKLADEKKKQSSHDLPERRSVKPKAKISTKTRGDFLTKDQEHSSKTISKSPKTTESPSSTSKLSISKLPRIPKTLGNKTDNEVPTVSDKKIPKKIKLINSLPETLTKLSSKEMKQIKSSSIKLIDIFAGTKIQKKNKNNDTEKEKENRVPNSSKKVSFSSDEPEVRVFEIDPGNTLKKCVQKDALLPQKFSKPPIKLTNPEISNPKLEEFLLRLFHWNPAWLKEQMTIKEPPPVVDYNGLRPLLSAYSSYDDYYKIMSPLLALELWSGISKDFEFNEHRSRHPPIMACITPNTITRQSVPATNLLVTTFLLQAVVAKDQISGQHHPVMGDLVIFRIVLKKNGVKQYHTIFAYVSQVDQRVIAPYTKFNKNLLNNVTNPHTLLTYSIMTKPLPVNVEVDDVQKLMTVSYLRSSMRMIQALQYLPTSPLLNQILQPTVNQYQLPRVRDYESYSLTTKEKLNSKQMEAVLKITETVVQRIPKICMIQGPPGTGKSKVIVNTVTEILYGNNRYQHHKPRRILVCAPSNAAIDEIVLRLMDIRTNLPKDQRFKMVRIGKQDSMHKSVRSISVSELAKRDVEKTTSDYFNGQDMQSIEEEKNFLKARINAIEAELEYSKNKDENCKQYILRKLAGVKVKFDLLNNPRNCATGVNPRQLMKLQRSAENTILSGADVITCTLSSCYTNQMETIFGGNKDKISVCIVDEATQSSEAETLIPLMLGVNTLVLVGDPNQLPATVISQDAKKLGLDQSLFARLYNAFDGQLNNPVIILDTQYRMSYPIAYWPNRYFYAGALKNSANQKQLPFHFYRVINLASTQNDDRFSNTNEAMFIANIIQTMMIYSKLENFEGILKVGIITPYNNQKNVLNGKIRDVTASVAENIRKKIQIEVNTVDSFQGQERDVIIMSCVRSAGIGFLSDRQRLCVALTRAKHSLFICGNFRTFEKDDMWKTLLTDARSRQGVYVDVNYGAGPSAIKTHIIKS